MAAGKYDFTIEQGTTHVQDFIWQSDLGVPINITGYSVRMNVRDNVYAPDPPLFVADATNGRFVVSAGPLGRFTLALTATETAALNWKQGVYDIELVSPGGAVTRVLKGTIVIDPEVTRTTEP